jgi:hypothetical protein
MRWNDKDRRALIAICGVAASLAWGCSYRSSTVSGTPDAGTDAVDDTGHEVADPPSDPAADLPTDAAADTLRDTPVDVGPDVPCTAAPPCPDGPEDGPLGRSCITDADCSDVENAGCMMELTETFESEFYVTYPGGTCQLWTGGSLACDPLDDSGCPPGSHCIHAGVGYGGIDYYGCIDACAPGDASGALHDWACGCRMGYRCDIGYEVCLSGCSNDRECCERWNDRDADGRRDEGEVVLWPECGMYCDGDDPDETADCRASYACVNPGTAGALVGDPCEHDHQCPVDGMCLSYEDPATGEDVYPGGYCTRMGCEYVGRGCATDGGACLNTGSYDDPRGMCLKPCRTGSGPGDPGFECRETAGQEHACFPVDAMAWIGGVPEGADGYCMPGNFASGTGGLGEPCEDDSECRSPLGLGRCMEWFGDPPFCSVACNEELAEGGVCGEEDPEGVATGLCGWNNCFAGCSSPGGPLGDNGCARPDLACAPLSVFGSPTWVVEGAAKPTGFCMPACENDAACASLFGPGSVCDVSSGVCG